MSILDAILASEAFDASDPRTVSFAARVSSSPTTYSWSTPGSDRIIAEGGSIATDGSGAATGGVVTKISFDLGNDGDIDGTITGISVPLVSLVDSADRFWSTVMKGSDTVHAPVALGAILFGDYLTAFGSTTLVGGQDSIDGGSGLAQTFYGDAATVGQDAANGGMTGHLTAGRDTITVNNTTGTSTIIGDAAKVDYNSRLDGNADVLTGSDTRGDIIYGDADLVFHSSAGGANDTIDGRGGDDVLVGDFNRTERFPGSTGGPFVIGGHDVIHGGEGKDTIIGDFQTVANFDVGAFSVARSGNDRLFGDAGDDTIYGDAVDFNDALSSFGRDYIDGGAGNDTIYGDARGTDAIPPSAIYFGRDEIHGGSDNDFIDAGVGADLVFGDAGNDTLVGGTGNDLLNGGADADVFRFLLYSGDDRIGDFADNVDELQISSAYGFATPADVVATARTNGVDIILKLDAHDYITLLGFGSNANALLDDIVII